MQEPFTLDPRSPHKIWDLMNKASEGDEASMATLKKAAKYNICWSRRHFLLAFDKSFVNDCYTVFIQEDTPSQYASPKYYSKYFAFPSSIDITKVAYQNNAYTFVLANGETVKSNLRQLGLIDHQVPFRRTEKFHVENIFRRFKTQVSMAKGGIYEDAQYGKFQFSEEYGFISLQVVPLAGFAPHLAIHTADVNILEKCLRQLGEFQKSLKAWEKQCRERLIETFNPTPKEIDKMALHSIVFFPEGEFNLLYDASPDWEYVGGLFSARGKYITYDLGNF